MRSFKKFVVESIEQAELDEAIEVRHDRYMRSHGKKASGGTGSWMFTHKAMGDVDHKNEKEVYSAPSGKFSDAKKAAQQWAKKHGHSTVYVMESVELDEASTKIEIPKSRYSTIANMHDASGPSHGKVTRSPKGTMQYKGARHSQFDKKTDTHIEQTYSHGDHSLATIEKHTHKPSGKVKYYMYKNMKEEVDLDEGKNLTDTKSDWRYDKSATAKNWSHNKLMKVAKHDRSAEKEIKRRIASKEYVFANEEAEITEASDLRITKVYNKFPKKATYAVHSSDRKYYKEFDSMEKAQAHHDEKTGK